MSKHLTCLLLLACACGGDEADTFGGAPDAGADARPPPPAVFYDAGFRPDPFDFEPADPAEPIPAHYDAGPAPMPAGDAGPVRPQPRNCLALAPGDELVIEDRLTADRLWLRIDAEAGCPSEHLTAVEVAYVAYRLCPHADARRLALTMLGADQLEIPPRDAVADPMLVVYGDQEQFASDPFACLAANDDGWFDGLRSNSARIEDLVIAPGDGALVIATSYNPPEERGVGVFELLLSAE